MFVVRRIVRAAAAGTVLVAIGGAAPAATIGPAPVPRARHLPHGCLPPPAHVNVRVPVPILFTTRCGRYRLSRKGSIERTGSRPAWDPREEIGWPDGSGAGVEGGKPRGHLVIYRRGRPVWTSTRSFRILGTPHYLQSVAVGPSAVAFSFSNAGLWIAPKDGAEKLVGHKNKNENAVIWTRRGDLVTSRWRNGGSELLVQDRAGHRTGIVTRWTKQYVVDGADRSLLYLQHDRLMRFDGARRTVIASLRSLGLRRVYDIELLTSRLIWLQSWDRAAVLWPDGRTFATASFPGSWNQGRYERGKFAPPGYPIADPSGHAVGYVRTRSEPASEEVFVLRGGRSTPELVYRHSADLAGCERGVTLAWHGRFLLYATSEGLSAVIDSKRRAAPTTLSAVVRRIPGSDDTNFGLQVMWASNKA